MTRPTSGVETCPACGRPAHASETDDRGLHPGCATPALVAHRVCCATLSCSGRGRYSLPEFVVFASSAQEAAWLVERIVLCDRRASDGMLWRIEGSLCAGDHTRDFVVQMVPDGGVRSTLLQERLFGA